MFEGFGRRLGVFFATMMMSAQSFAAGDFNTGFGEKLKTLVCGFLDKNGPIVPTVAFLAIAIFGLMLILGEAKGYVTWILRVLIGIAVVVFVPTLLQTTFDINICGSSGAGTFV